MKGLLFIYDPESDQRDAVLARVCTAAEQQGRKVHIWIRDPIKSREQEEKYHAMLADIARDCRLFGKELGEESWKRLCVDAFKHETKDDPDFSDHWRRTGSIETLPALNHPGFVILGEQTRSFGVKLATGFIEWLLAFGANPQESSNGVATCIAPRGQVRWTESKRNQQRWGLE
jgi:hypothetical protein